MKKSTRVFIVVGILFIASVLLFSFSVVFLRVYDFFVAIEGTSISKFKICALDNLTKNEDASCGNSFPVGIPELYACGYVNADYLKPGDFVSFQIYLDDDKATLPLYKNRVDDEFTTGNFCRKIIIPSNSKPGLYHVRVYFYRDSVASAQFELK